MVVVNFEGSWFLFPDIHICIYILTVNVKSLILLGHLISFNLWVNNIHEIKCQRKYLFPIHLAGFIKNPRNQMPTYLSLI